MDINLDEMLQKTKQDMDNAEDALVRMGFPEDQWVLIRKYILSATLLMQITTAKAWENFTLTDPKP
jgi:hypothetical protein